MGCWWGRGDCYSHRIFELDGVFGGAEEGVDCWCGIEVRDVFFFEELPDEWVVDFS